MASVLALTANLDGFAASSVLAAADDRIFGSTHPTPNSPLADTLFLEELQLGDLPGTAISPKDEDPALDAHDPAVLDARETRGASLSRYGGAVDYKFGFVSKAHEVRPRATANVLSKHFQCKYRKKELRDAVEFGELPKSPGMLHGGHGGDDDNEEPGGISQVMRTRAIKQSRDWAKKLRRGPLSGSLADKIDRARSDQMRRAANAAAKRDERRERREQEAKRKAREDARAGGGGGHGAGQPGAGAQQQPPPQQQHNKPGGGGAGGKPRERSKSGFGGKKKKGKKKPTFVGGLTGGKKPIAQSETSRDFMLDNFSSSLGSTRHEHPSLPSLSTHWR